MKTYQAQKIFRFRILAVFQKIKLQSKEANLRLFFRLLGANFGSLSGLEWYPTRSIKSGTIWVPILPYNRGRNGITLWLQSVIPFGAPRQTLIEKSKQCAESTSKKGCPNWYSSRCTKLGSKLVSKQAPNRCLKQYLNWCIKLVFEMVSKYDAPNWCLKCCPSRCIKLSRQLKHKHLPFCLVGLLKVVAVTHPSR